MTASLGRQRADSGKWAEVLFDVEVGKRMGYPVWRPICGSLPYDRVIVIGDRFVRVQVKTVGADGRMHVRSVPGNTKGPVPYRPDDFDFLVGVDDHDRCFYVLPMEVVQDFDVTTVRTTRLQPYRDAFHLLTDMQNLHSHA